MNKQMNSTKATLSSIEKYLEELVAKFPKMPDKGAGIVVSIAPWLTVLSLIMLVPVILALFGMSAFVPFTMMAGVSYGYGVIVSGIGSVIIFILYATALSGLFNRQKAAWDKLFLAYLVGLAMDVINFQLGSLIIGGAVGAYILFSVKKYYK